MYNRQQNCCCQIAIIVSAKAVHVCEGMSLYNNLVASLQALSTYLAWARMAHKTIFPKVYGLSFEVALHVETLSPVL